MDKPLTLKMRETREGIAQVLNESGLHIALLQTVINEVKQEIDYTYQAVEQQEEDEYAQMQQQAQASSSEEEEASVDDNHL